jgi:hypothetical protein
MRRTIFLLVTVWLGLSIDAHGQIPFEYRELGTCSSAGNPYGTDGILQARKVGSKQVLLATVPLNCGSRVKLTVEDGRPIYVNIEDSFVKGEARAICNCMRRFEITLNSPVPAGTTIWLLGNSRGAARTSAE